MEDEPRLRPAQLDDADQLADFLTRCTDAYLGRPSSREEAIARLTVSGRDPEASAVVAEIEEGRIVGFGNVWVAGRDDIKCFARVDPALTGRGVGVTLLGNLQRRARELAVETESIEPVLTGTQWARDTRGAALFAFCGFSELRFYLRMIVDDLSHLDPGDAALPETLTLRTFRPDHDDADLYEAWTEAFADEWGQGEGDSEGWWRERRELEAAAFDPSLWLVAVADRIVGFVLAREEAGGGAGYISDIGVLPEWRGRGVGYALLIESFRVLRRHGFHSASLNVDSDNRTSALRLYRKAGMREVPNFTIWAKPLF